MKKINLFTLIWILIGLTLVVISFFYRRQSDAIVALVEPQKIAVSFQKPVKIKTVHIMPGQDVSEGDLLIELERPDLLFDIYRVTNELNTLLNEKKMVIDDINSRIQQILVEKRSKISDIEGQVLQLNIQQSQNKQVISAFEYSLIDQEDSLNMTRGLIQLQIDALNREKQHFISLYDQQLIQLRERKINENEIYALRKERLEQELEIYIQEKNILNNYSPINGTVGDVMAQAGELKPPYETILSIYESHPRIIKAYMNEENKYNLEVGDSVHVESSNRNYTINGKVIEVGSRIVSYPPKLLIDQEITIWGQEIFIEIPPDNQFLNGEKVFVRKK